MKIGISYRLILLFCFHSILTGCWVQSKGQTIATIEAKSFGMVADGKTDNTNAFKALADYINKRKGNVVVLFDAGVYKAGRQQKSLRREQFYLSCQDVFELKSVSNVTLRGVAGTKFMYSDGLYYGSFETANMKAKAVQKDFYQPQSAAYVGNFLSITNGQKILIEAIEFDGNAAKSVRGGAYGDVGIQIPYTGIYIRNTRDITLRKIQAGNFGLDGCIVANRMGPQAPPDNVYIYECRFYLNGRQGLSWISGNHLEALNSRFELTGKGVYSSAPGAGLDIESEEAPIRNGRFVNCIFYNNTGSAMVSETGDVANCRFDSCSFIGITNWSVWVRQPGFSFYDCNFWGSGVHGYSAANDAEATRFIRCRFTDEPYENQKTFGNYLFESNGVKRLSFENCSFEARSRKVLWLDGLSPMNPDEFYRVADCTFQVETPLQGNDFYTVLRRVNLENNRWELSPQIMNNRNPAIGIDDAAELNRVVNNKKELLRKNKTAVGE